MRRFVTILAALALAIFAIGFALVPLTLPVSTRLAASRFSEVQQAGLPKDRVLELAEGVRAFVVGSAEESEALPATVDGRAGFDRGAVSHLEDVRGVIRNAQLVTGLLAALVTLWMAMSLVAKRTDEIARALRIAAWVDVAIVVLLGVIGVTSFDRFFAAFHSLFFAAGTWTFPYDSLLIELFPEPFWITAGIAWGLLVLLFAGLYALAAVPLSRERVAR